MKVWGNPEDKVEVAQFYMSAGCLKDLALALELGARGTEGVVHKERADTFLFSWSLLREDNSNCLEHRVLHSTECPNQAAVLHLRGKCAF